MSSELILRDYQIEAVYSMIEAAKRVRGRGGGRAERCLVIQPTGHATDGSSSFSVPACAGC